MDELVRKAADNDKVFKEPPKGIIEISVRGLVEFILRSGDIDNRIGALKENAMQEGSRIHKKIQKSMGGCYTPEYPLSFKYDAGEYDICISGRADGIIDDGKELLIDEIKGTYRKLDRMKEPVPVHLAQAKCYAYMYGAEKSCGDKDELRVRMTYCNMETEELKYFFFDYEFKELSLWFHDVLEKYRLFSDFVWNWRKERNSSIEGVEFPFEYRSGQRELVTNVYSTIYHSKKLFMEAPTGVGKTISTIFPSIKAFERGICEKLFYLTARTITRSVACDTFNILRNEGLRFKSVVITAKEKICPMEERKCNPEYCPYAKGHFDRVNDAIYKLLQNEDDIDRDTIRRYSEEYNVCPFELSLDVSSFSDGIICDYNYVFDPHVRLQRYFASGERGEYVFLIDEAHNLVDRAREMYSAKISEEQLKELRRKIKYAINEELTEAKANKRKLKQVEGQISLEMLTDAANTELSEKEYRVEEEGNITDTLYYSSRKNKNNEGSSIFVRKGYGEIISARLKHCIKELEELKEDCDNYVLIENVSGFENALAGVYSAIADYLSETEENAPDIKEDVLDFYFELGHFLEIHEEMDENYVIYAEKIENTDFFVKLLCVNPSIRLRDCMSQGRSSILFSATMLPIQYFKRLLGGNEEDYEVYAKSVFNPEKLGVFVANDVTSKYTRRSDEEYDRIAEHIHRIVRERAGNYMVFAPSYTFMQRVIEKYEARADEIVDIIVQNEHMSEAEREEFLKMFTLPEADISLRAADINMEIEKEDRSLVAFCVLGGIFSEGIDLKNDSLIGAIIIGTGLPLVCNEREIFKGYFDEDGENGFDYAYRIPGMNKVLQAAGRVIRTEDDFGIAVLLDERFITASYRRMFPREWSDLKVVDIKSAGKQVEYFWNEWL